MDAKRKGFLHVLDMLIDNELDLSNTCDGGNPEPYRRLRALVETNRFQPENVPADLEDELTVFCDESRHSGLYFWGNEAV